MVTVSSNICVKVVTTIIILPVFLFPKGEGQAGPAPSAACCGGVKGLNSSLSVQQSAVALTPATPLDFPENVASASPSRPVVLYFLFDEKLRLYVFHDLINELLDKLEAI